MSAPIRIAARDARRLAIAAQRLAGSRPRPTRAGILGLVRDIGYLQLDPTNVVARNPYQVVWSRVGAYDTTRLDDLLARRELFETPSLILPLSDLSIHLATMRAYRRSTDPGGRHERYHPGGDNSGGGTWAKRVRGWLTENRHMRQQVLARLRRDGPLPLTAFEDRAVVSWTSGGWNDERNLTMLLAILQRRGEVVVAARRNGQKLYAVADGWFDGVRPLPPTALAREAALRALRAIGLATPQHFRWYYGFNRHITKDAVAALEGDGEIVRVEVEGVRGTFYTASDVERRLRRARDEWEPRTTLLSPFDNLIMDRNRTEQLFEYFYRMEIYVPPRLRKRGYWAMPVLIGDAIVGSVDPRLDHEKGELVVNTVVLEPRAPKSAMREIKSAISELADWVGASRVRWPSA